MDWMTARDAARRVGVGYSTFKQWIYQGSVRTTRTPGGHHRVAVSEVERLLANAGQLPERLAAARPAQRPPAVVALSTRNQLRGVIEEVRTDGLLAQVRLRVGDNVVTAVITKDAVVALGLRRGQSAIALIKSTEVMIACEPGAAVARASKRRPRRAAPRTRRA